MVALPCAAQDPRPAGTAGTAGAGAFFAVDDRVYRGSQPSDAVLRQLAALGIRTVVDFREPGRRADAEKRTVEALGMRYVNIPLPGLRAPSPEQVAQALALLDPAAISGWPVFLHCMRGKDRTGLVVACYRIAYYHWDPQKALEEARHFGLSPFEPDMQHFIAGYRPPPQPPARGLSASTSK